MTASLPRRVARRVKHRGERAALQAYYRRRLREPIDPTLAVFATYWYRGYGCNPKAVYQAAKRSVPGFRGVWVVKPERAELMPGDVEFVVPGTRAYYDVLARAGAFVNNVNFPNELVKRPGTVHVMTHHGTPLKHMGLDLRGKPVPEGQIDFDALLRRCARWDFSVSSNRHSTRVWEQAYPGPYESLEVGYPRNDVLVRAGEGDRSRLREQFGAGPGQRVLLYAPTHRDNDSAYVARLDVTKLAERLGPDWMILARLHHFYESDPSRERIAGAARIVDVASHPSIEELCIASDALVTDYSSVMFDYAILDRPMVIFAPDWEDYKASRGTYFDLLANPPGAVARTADELAHAFVSGDAFAAGAEASRARFRDTFCAFEHGTASEAVVERIWPGVARPVG